jgi:glutamyl-tRNA synthetase
MVTGILEGMRWLGLTWDEGPDTGGPYAPYFQSERLEQYRAAADRLLADDRAYACYCSPERLRAERERAEQRGEAWQYDRACMRLTDEERNALDIAGAPKAIRFKVPDGVTRFDDAVHGPIEFDAKNIEDFVILRSDRFPTYHLSVVVDDVEMRISDVIRGDDHISNTPKHVLLFEALGAPVPRFAHVPLILGADKKRLSKRHGATSVTEYARQGYLPAAMLNFLALLGWSPGGDREVMTARELVEAFTLEGISGGNAVFNTEKLDWMNAQYLAQLPVDALAVAVRPFVEETGLATDPIIRDTTSFQRLLELLRPRAKRLTEFAEQARPLLTDDVTYEADALAKHLSTVGVADHVAAVTDALRTVSPFDEPHVENTVRGSAAERGIKAGQLIHAIRVALTGRTASPGLFELIVLLGRERTVLRLERLLAFLASR